MNLFARLCVVCLLIVGCGPVTEIPATGINRCASSTTAPTSADACGTWTGSGAARYACFRCSNASGCVGPGTVYCTKDCKARECR